VYGAENWALRKVDQKYLGSSEIWCCISMEKIAWKDRVKKEESMWRGISYKQQKE
jgi:hypothetical protein